MKKVILTVGIPGAGKSTWAMSEVAKDPGNWAHINNDQLRMMLNGSVWTAEYEKFITDARNMLTTEALKRGKNVIIDNLNLNRRHFDTVVKIASSLKKEFQIFEKPFYIDLDVAIERDAKREGKAQVGEAVIRKWWKDSGGTQFKFFKPRSVIITPAYTTNDEADKLIQDNRLPKAIMCDLDGTLSLLNGRNPFDASNCDQDLPNKPVIECVKAMYAAGNAIVFMSGREDKYREPTLRFIAEHLPGMKYELYMRSTNDSRKDSIVKGELFAANVAPRFNVLCVFDDRGQVVNYWRSIGLTCMQVAEGNF